MKRIGLSLLTTMLLLAIFTFGVYSQGDDPTPTPTAAETLPAEGEEGADADAATLATQTAVAALVDVRNRIPISLPLFLPPVITNVQVVTVPVSMNVALPVADLGLSPVVTGADLITTPLTLDLVLQVAPSGTITVVTAGVPELAAAAFYTPAPAAAPEITGTVVLTGANLRTGPGTNYPRIGGVAANQAIEIVGRDEQGTWYQLADGAWIAAFLVQNAPVDLPVIEAPPVPTPTPTATAVLTPTAIAATPAPTATATATPTTDAGAEEALSLYLETVTPLATTVNDAVVALTDLLAAPQIADATWQQDIIAQTALIQDASVQLAEVVPPGTLIGAHDTLTDAVDACSNAADALVSAIDDGDEEAIETVAILIQGCGEAIGAVDL